MRRLAVRVLLAGLLIAGITQKVWLTHSTPPDIRADVITLLLRHGWSAHPMIGHPDQPLTKTAVTFQATGCKKEGRVFVVGLGLQDAPMLDHVIEADYSRRFVYLGRAWPAQDRVEMRLEWLKQKALTLLGRGRFTVNEAALVIAEPNDCRSADAVDWSVLWARRA
jgi:hypothetical protein